MKSSTIIDFSLGSAAPPPAVPPTVCPATSWTAVISQLSAWVSSIGNFRSYLLAKTAIGLLWIHFPLHSASCAAPDKCMYVWDLSPPFWKQGGLHTSCFRVPRLNTDHKAFADCLARSRYRFLRPIGPVHIYNFFHLFTAANSLSVWYRNLIIDKLAGLHLLFLLFLKSANFKYTYFYSKIVAETKPSSLFSLLLKCLFLFRMLSFVSKILPNAEEQKVQVVYRLKAKCSTV